MYYDILSISIPIEKQIQSKSLILLEGGDFIKIMTIKIKDCLLK